MLRKCFYFKVFIVGSLYLFFLIKKVGSIHFKIVIMFESQQ